MCMKLKKLIVFCILSICRIFLVFTKIDDQKITFVSLESDQLTGDFKIISDELNKENKYKLNYILVKFEKSLKGNFEYFLSCIKQLFEINTSRLVILDYNNYVVSNFKRKGVKVLQLWHASGAIKKFGNDVSRDYAISGYDYVIVNCDYFVPHFASAFGVDEASVKVTGIPKTDRLFNKRKIKNDQKWMYQHYPQIKNKKVILYAPTFRGKLMHGLGNSSIDLDRIQRELGDEYVILYKMHPLLENVFISESDDVICCNGKSIKKLFSVTDYMISDYSAIIIDYSVFERPMLFYTPDLEEYRGDVGFYVDYENIMPGPICRKEDDIIDAIRKDSFDINKIKAFKNQFFKYQDGKSRKRVVALIDEIMAGGNV